MNEATIANRCLFTDVLLGQALESRLREMFVKGERGFDPQAFHDDKRRAVGQRIAFVGLVGEFAPCLREYRFVDVHECSNPAIEQRLADFDRLGMMPAAIEKCNDLVEYVRGRYECNPALADFTPSGDRRGMVLIVRRFQRDQKTGVEKICRHDPLYKWAS